MELKATKDENLKFEEVRIRRPIFTIRPPNLLLIFTL